MRIMPAIARGSAAPAVPGLDFTAGPTALFFYKVTCPVCQMTAPAVQALHRAYPGRVAAVGQDPEPKLRAFETRFGLQVATQPDPTPYVLSSSYGVRVVPTTFLVGTNGVIVDVVESWDRDGLNALSAELAKLAGLAYAPISEVGDGLPAFRPG